MIEEIPNFISKSTTIMVKLPKNWIFIFDIHIKNIPIFLNRKMPIVSVTERCKRKYVLVEVVAFTLFFMVIFLLRIVLTSRLHNGKGPTLLI